jgi:hypothetical protein
MQKKKTEARHATGIVLTKTDLTGRSFGTWTVLRRDKDKPWLVYWVCRCECGTIASVFGGNLKNGMSSRCKKCANARFAKSNTKHGDCKSNLYKRWANYKHLGYLCDRWLDYRTFAADLPRPIPKGRMRRKDLTKPLGPDNYTFGPLNSLTPEEEETLRNSTGVVRKLRIAEARFVGLTLQQIADILHVSRERVRQLAGNNQIPNRIIELEHRIERCRIKTEEATEEIQQLKSLLE